MIPPRNAVCLGFALLFGANVARPAAFCVNSPASLLSSLATAQANGSDDQIRIVAGNYPLTVEPSYISGDGRALDISGGWNAACNAEGSGTTTLNGQNLVRALRLEPASLPSASITVRDLTLISGYTDSIGGGGLRIRGGIGAVVVERNQIFGNRSDVGGGGLDVLTDGPLLVRGNLVFGNSAAYGGGATLSTGDPNFYVTGNTIVGNTVGPALAVAGLSVTATAPSYVWISNNIVWNNTANGTSYDLRITGSNVLLHNDVGVMSGSTPTDALSQGNVSVDPTFAPCSGFLCVNFRLKSSSPLIDAGFDGSPGGVGDEDLDRARRIAGAHVDVGAYEFDRIFADDFE